MSTEYPKNLFRDGDSFTWEGRGFDGLIVNDKAEEAAAIKDGWRVDPFEEAPKRNPRK